MSPADRVITGPSGTEYHLPAGQELSRIDWFVGRLRERRMHPEDADALLDVRHKIQAAQETP